MPTPSDRPTERTSKKNQPADKRQRVQIELDAATVRGLAEESNRSGFSRPNIIRQAIKMFLWLKEQQRDGAELALMKDDKVTLVKVFG